MGITTKHSIGDTIYYLLRKNVSKQCPDCNCKRKIYNARLLEAQYNIAAINKCLFPVISDESPEAYKIFIRLKSEIKTAQKELDGYEMKKNKLKNFYVMWEKQS